MFCVSTVVSVHWIDLFDEEAAFKTDTEAQIVIGWYSSDSNNVSTKFSTGVIWGIGSATGLCERFVSNWSLSTYGSLSITSSSDRRRSSNFSSSPLLFV